MHAVVIYFLHAIRTIDKENFTLLEPFTQAYLNGIRVVMPNLYAIQATEPLPPKIF